MTKGKRIIAAIALIDSNTYVINKFHLKTTRTMEKRINYASGSIWEDFVGYSRVVKVGNVIEVAGTVAAGNDGKVVGKDDVYAQTKFILKKIVDSLEMVGAKSKDIIRTRMYVTNISNWEEIGKAHSEFFSEIKPVATIVEVKGLIGPDFLIEIEATALM